MYLALDAPTPMLEKNGISFFSDFEMVSAQRLLEDEGYKAYYTKPSELSKILNVDIEIKAEVIKVLASETLVATIAVKDPSYNTTDLDTMGIVQGVDFEDAQMSIIHLLGGPSVKVLGVPFNICSQPTDSPEIMALRRVLVVNLIPADKPVHLLGFVSLKEFWWYKGRQDMSLNTGVPVSLGLRSMDILDPLKDKAVPTAEMFKKLSVDSKNWAVVCRNIALLRKYI